MAVIRFSLAEAVATIKGNIKLPPAISNVCATCREIEIATVYGLRFTVSYKSYSDGWLELEVKGSGWVGRLIAATLGAKLLGILAPHWIRSGAAQTRGHSVFLDTYQLLDQLQGIRIREIQADQDGLTIRVDVDNCL